VSLLGGGVEAQLANPMEYSWRLASLVGASCFFFPAPLLVDSEETRRRLIDRCGLDRIETLAAGLDIAVISAGDVAVGSTSLSRDLISEAEARELVALGAVADVMCHFLDAEGRTVDHPVNRRVMSVSPDTVARAGHVVLASGGAHRAVAIRAACRRFGCDTLVTDEHAARAILGL
jgi:DNA-binding transcriptional regulator LsrR (DeoR family)